MRAYDAARAAAGAVLHPCVRRHVVDVVAAVEVVEALRGGEIFAVVAEVPFADGVGVVSYRVQHFGKGDLVAEHAVDVV